MKFTYEKFSVYYYTIWQLNKKLIGIIDDDFEILALELTRLIRKTNSITALIFSLL